LNHLDFNPDQQFTKRISQKDSSEQLKTCLQNNYKNKLQKDRKRMTQTQNIHKLLPVRNKRWKVVLGNLTLITDAIKC
jgi:hypothetical protein